MLSAFALPECAPQHSRILFYPAAGFDWKLPLTLSRLFRRYANLPGVDLAIYVDYSLELAQQLEGARVAGDSLHWGPEIRGENITAIRPSDDIVRNLRRWGQNAPAGGSCTGDYWYALDLHLPHYRLPILYVPADAVAFASSVLSPLGLKPTYVVTVTDGCRQGGNWCCLSKREGPFFQVLETADLLPSYWLTDHGNLDFPVFAQVKAGIYGKGESSLYTLN